MSWGWVIGLRANVLRLWLGPNDSWLALWEQGAKGAKMLVLARANVQGALCLYLSLALMHGNSFLNTSSVQLFHCVPRPKIAAVMWFV